MRGFKPGDAAGAAKVEATSRTAAPSYRSSALQVYAPALLFVTCLAAQLYLVFSKSFNWDEFLHFNYVYQIKSGTLNLPFQVVHLRFLLWATEISANLLNQMLAARIFVWSVHLLTLGMIYGLARQFTSASNAFFASFAFLTAGYVFTQGFSVRADPMVTATLMSALFLLAKGRLSLTKSIAIGALVGLAGMMTFKAAFYAPCFAGLAWLKFREAPHKRAFLGQLAMVVIAAFLSFIAIYQFHTWDFARAGGSLRSTSSVSLYARWLTFNLQFAGYIGREMIFAPLFFICVVLAPGAWKRAGLNADERIAFAGLIAPLIVLLFYRNTFPYFFTFILAPVAVAIAPALGMVRDRYGNLFLSLMLSAVPLTLAFLEPRDVIVRQRALIDYVHEEFPEGTGYLDYSGMISDYPRVLKFLTSGNGMRYYREQGDAAIGRAIENGQLPFIIANQEVVLAALEGRPGPETFLPADLAAMKGNYVQQWGVLWREGKQIPSGSRMFEFHLSRGGAFVLAGDTLIIDGVTVADGANIELDQGRHLVSGDRQSPSILWRGDRLPATPPEVSIDSVFTQF